MSAEPSSPHRVLPRLDLYQSPLDRGRPRTVEVMWMLVQSLFFASWLPGSAWRVVLLRLFGAQVGHGVIIKPFVRVKFPWRLTIGDFSWIGEQVWIDNLARVEVGSHCCVSQGAYFCTGSHDWSDPRFGLITAPIELEDGAWIGARAVLAPGVLVGQGAVLALGSVATKDMAPFHLYTGVPAQLVKEIRVAKAATGDAS